MERAELVSPDEGADLRIALLVDSLWQPRWVYRAIHAVRDSGLARIVLVVKPDGPDGPGAALPLRFWRSLAHMGSRVYSGFDDWLFRREADALVRVSLEPLLEDIETLKIPAAHWRGDRGLR